jgi:DNA-binding IclR family transcriptional regulator
MSQTVQRAIAILELVAERPRTVAEIGERLVVHRTTALRLLQTLQDGGLVRRQPSGHYGVGFRLTGLAHLALEQFDLASVARPHLVALNASCSHTIHLAALEATKIVYVDKIEPSNKVRMHSQVGHPVCLHTAGVSKAILAHLAPERLHALLDGYQFTKYTDTTIDSLEGFEASLEQVRRQGWATDNAELESYVNCIAAPIRDGAGQVIAAVSVTALRAIADLGALQALLPQLLETTTGISKELGWKASAGSSPIPSRDNR